MAFVKVVNYLLFDIFSYVARKKKEEIFLNTICTFFINLFEPLSMDKRVTSLLTYS